MDINLSILLLLCLIFMLIGGVSMLLLQYYVYMKFSLLPDETNEQKDFSTKYSLPASLSEAARKCSGNNPISSAECTTTDVSSNISTSASLKALNFVLQFLFHELKNSNGVRKWFYRKVSLELDELLAKTTTGKLFDKLTIKQLELGDQFPEIRTLKVHSIELDETGGRIENLDLLLDIRYKGNFRTSIDADMVLGKKASISLTVKELSGVARLQFTRRPYTHWSLSFLGDPALNVDIESKYQGRQMQSNVTSLISNQIRKAVRRKHTLPNYKLRYKPFFHPSTDEDIGDGDIQPNGILKVQILEISRLMCPEHLNDIYSVITMASMAFVEARQQDDRNVLMSLDVEIHKAKNQQIGIVFKQLSADRVAIETVLPNTPACKSNLKAGDILMSIQGRRVVTIQQVAKIMKTLQRNVFNLRIDRIVPGIIRNDAILEDLDVYEDFNEVRSTSTPTVDYIDSPPQSLLRQVTLRNSTIEKGTSSESSMGSTPTSSPKKSRLIAKALKKTISRDHDDSRWRKSHSKLSSSAPVLCRKSTKGLLDIPNPVNSNSNNLSNTTASINNVEHYYQHSTADCQLAPMIYVEDLCQFKLDVNCRFLNVCVYGKCSGENKLLGFTNISIAQILAESSETSLSQCFKTYELNPPIPQELKSHPLSSQMGFDPNLCFGDILIAFTWDGNPNLSLALDTPLKTTSKSKIKSGNFMDKTEDSGCYSDTLSMRSSSSDAIAMQAKALHSFVRTHFQRATQCDFCGKKIWLKDAVQCRECSMCCHKKCINKCQNATVCGPVECFNTLQAASTVAMTPEFTLTEPETIMEQQGIEEVILPSLSLDSMDTVEQNGTGTGTATATATTTTTITTTTATNASVVTTTITTTTTTTSICTTTTSASVPASLVNLEMHRGNLTDFLAQGMKRVNSTNNLAIPGLMGSMANTIDTISLGSNLALSVCRNANSSTKSMPPTPQHSPSSRKQSVSSGGNGCSAFEQAILQLEALTCQEISGELSVEQINAITEPIIQLAERQEDLMNLAKRASRQLYCDFTGNSRTERINLAITQLRRAVDSESARYSRLDELLKAKASTNLEYSDTDNIGGGQQMDLHKSEERLQALSVIMLYLCTGLQYIQGILTQ